MLGIDSLCSNRSVVLINSGVVNKEHINPNIIGNRGAARQSARTVPATVSSLKKHLDSRF